MMRKLRKLLACLCVLTIALSSVSALAEFSPWLDDLKRKDSVALTLEGSYEALNKLSKKSLETVNGWLAPLKVTVQGQLGGAMTSVAVTSGEEEVFSIAARRREDGVVTEFMPSGNGYLTGNDQKNALVLLAGEDLHVLDPLEIPELYAKLAKELYPVLEEKVTAKSKKARTTVKNAAASPSYVDYVFKAEELTAAWPEILDAAMPVLSEALADRPDLYNKAEAVLNGLTFSGECRFKRLLDKDQGDMGLQFTGSAAQGSDQRKVTLFGGYTKDKGGYLSLKLPQIKGKNNLTLQISVSLAKAKSSVRTLKTDVTYSRKYDGDTESATVTGTLKNTIKNDTEHWTGKVTVSQTKEKVKTTYSFTPDLAFDANGLSGKVTVQRTVGGKADMKAAVQVTAAEAPAFQLEDAAGNVQDLRRMSEGQARAAVQAELPALTGLVVRLMAGLPEEERALLTHELRTDAWMTAADPAEEALEEELPEDETPDDEALADAADEAADEEEAPADLSEEGPSDSAEEGFWEDAEYDDWPAAEQASQAAAAPASQEPAPRQDAPTQAADESGEDDWFGEDWFDDDGGWFEEDADWNEGEGEDDA